MHAIFDHLTAVIVGAVLIGAMLFIQTRHRQHALQAAVRHQAQTSATGFFGIAEREVENARTRDQAVHGLGYYAVDIAGSADRTDRLTLVTTQRDAATGTAFPLGVSYRLVATGETVRVGDADRPTYRVERYEDRIGGGGAFALTGVVAENVVSFRARAFDAAGAPVTRAGTSGGYGRSGWNTSRDDDPVRFELELETATPLPARVSQDQASTTHANLSRRTRSIRLANANATGPGTTGVSAVTARDVPLLPGEATPPPPPPPSPPSPSIPSPPSPPPTTTTPSPPPSSPAPAPAPPTRPAPPPGRQI